MDGGVPVRNHHSFDCLPPSSLSRPGAASKKVAAIYIVWTLLAIAPDLAGAQKTVDQGKTIVYDDITQGPNAIDRDAKKAYAGKFRFVDVKQSDGFTPDRLKGPNVYFADPRPMREEVVPGKIVFAYVVTPEGGVIEPRILHSTDRRVSDYLFNLITNQRFVPPRFRGVPVFSLHGGEIVFGSERPRDSDLFKNGLGIQGYRDR